MRGQLKQLRKVEQNFLSYKANSFNHRVLYNNYVVSTVSIGYLKGYPQRS